MQEDSADGNCTPTTNMQLSEGSQGSQSTGGGGAPGKYLRRLESLEIELDKYKTKCEALQTQAANFFAWKASVDNWLFENFAVTLTPNVAGFETTVKTEAEERIQKDEENSVGSTSSSVCGSSVAAKPNGVGPTRRETIETESTSTISLREVDSSSEVHVQVGPSSMEFSHEEDNFVNPNIKIGSVKSLKSNESATSAASGQNYQNKKSAVGTSITNGGDDFNATVAIGHDEQRNGGSTTNNLEEKTEGKILARSSPRRKADSPSPAKNQNGGIAIGRGGVSLHIERVKAPSIPLLNSTPVVSNGSNASPSTPSTPTPTIRIPLPRVDMPKKTATPGTPLNNSQKKIQLPVFASRAGRATNARNNDKLPKPPIAQRVDEDDEISIVFASPSTNRVEKTPTIGNVRPVIVPESSFMEQEQETYMNPNITPENIVVEPPMPMREELSRAEQFNLLLVETDDPTPCGVCMGIEPENGNEMVFCDDCNLCVHQACYGVRPIPTGGWKCNPCRAGLKNAETACFFCPAKGGALKPVKSPSMKHWAHISCALWIPEVKPDNDRSMEPIVNVNKIPTARWKLRCSLCKDKHGACIQCQFNKRCTTAFHVTCAMKHGLDMKQIVSEHSAHGISLQASCKAHTNSKVAGKKRRSAGTPKKSTATKTDGANSPTPRKKSRFKDSDKSPDNTSTSNGVVGEP